MKRTFYKRFTSFLLGLCMLAALLPANILPVFAADGSVSATIYIDNGDGMYEDSEKVDTFAHDQQGLILDLRNFSPVVGSGWEVESLAFYPTDGSSEWGTVFWYNGEGEYFCDNGTPHDKLTNGVFQLNNFTPNGNQPLTPGDYKILVYVGNNDSGDYQETLYYSTEIFTLSEEGTSANDPVIVTSSLPDATYKQPYTYMMNGVPSTTGSTLTWSAENLPQGLTIDASTGIINGTPTEDGSFEVRFTVTENDKSASKTLNLNVYREQSSVQWETVEVKLSNHLKNVESNYTFTLVPTEEFTPDAGTELKISNFDTDFTDSTFSGLPGGITATGTKNELTLTFDGNTAVPAEGLSFTAQGALNGTLNTRPYIDRIIYGDAEIGWTYFLTIFFVDSAQYKLTISNYKDSELNGVTLSATMYDSDGRQFGIAQTVDKNGTVRFNIIEDMHDKGYTIKIGYKSSVFASHSFTADAYAAKEGTVNLDLNDNSIITVVSNVLLKPKSISFCFKKTEGSYTSIFAFSRLGNEYEYIVNKSELQQLINDGNILFNCEFQKNSDKYTYSQENGPDFRLDADNNILYVTYEEYDKNGTIRGKVTDNDGDPIIGAIVSASPISSPTIYVNTMSENFYTITDENGDYEISQLRAEFNYMVSTSIDGYNTITQTAGRSQGGIGAEPYTLDLQLEKTGVIEIIVDGGNIVNAKYTVVDKNNQYKSIDIDAVSGNIYHITPYKGQTYDSGLVDGQYTVNIRGDNIESLKATVEIKNGYGQVTIKPTFYAELVFPHKGYILNAYLYRDNKFTQIGQYNYLTEGNYTLYVTQNRYNISNNQLVYSSIADIENDCDAGTAKKTDIVLKNGETFTVDSSMLPPAVTYVKGTVEAPSSAQTGEVYKITGIIENPDVEKIIISPTDLTYLNNENVVIKLITINGKIPIWHPGKNGTDQEGIVTIDKSA